MSILTGTMGYRDGLLCVVWRDRQFSEPVEVELWWPICGVSKATFDAEYAGRTCEGSLRNGGRTESIYTEKHPVPCPKVRKGIETRYRNGRWEKYLISAKGWTAA
jgi:hypothetical protein